MIAFISSSARYCRRLPYGGCLAAAKRSPSLFPHNPLQLPNQSVVKMSSEDDTVHVQVNSDATISALANTWHNCAEVMIDLPDEDGKMTMALVPKTTASHESTEKLPSIFLREGSIHVFALTAFDPPGKERTREENLLYNARLREDLERLHHRPVAIWSSVGVNLEQNWREEGFCVAYTADVVEEARKDILNVAVEFEQGAIFEYKAANDRELMRITLGACLPDSKVGDTSTLVRTNQQFDLGSGETMST